MLYISVLNTSAVTVTVLVPVPDCQSQTQGHGPVTGYVETKSHGWHPISAYDYSPFVCLFCCVLVTFHNLGVHIRALILDRGRV